MRLSILASAFVGAVAVSASPVLEQRQERSVEGDMVVVRDTIVYVEDCEVVTPKVFIISMFSPEADIWYKNAETPGSIGNLLAKNITVPGFSPLFPQAHCLADGSVCQLTTGESEINAASTISALMLSPLFDLKKTYFLIGGIAGINPKHGTLADVAFSKYAIQVALQYEFDAREIPENFTTGYVPQGAFAPDEYPSSIYGTEVFEVNEALRDIAVEFAKTAKLNDSTDAVAYRAHYTDEGVTIFEAATKAPGIITCDVATSDVYYSGALLGEAFENTTTLFTNGSGVYCMKAQEDNATLEAMIRAAINKVVDFSRIIIMRTASDFDRPYPGESDTFHLLYSTQGGFTPAIANIYLAGTPVVKGILDGWWKTFEKGVKPKNYIGDIFGTLGGTPDFGPGNAFGGIPQTTETEETSQVSRRDSYKRSPSRAMMKGALGAELARRANGNAES
ncbi:Purine nucleoside permease [Hyphodiscus hymeniophilus]|uniref:Purine nucleoside permease n=1 Tax=Hyphodiscus hymeniophilus TaxID=353542 RepID=A0A9P6SPQ0_9HELO|nr:Purine nucleoside permease [Hyphodiscus hymeniophilus]